MIYTVRTYLDKKRRIARRTKSSQRFFNILRTIIFKNRNLRVYIKLDYGKGFINEGDYYNKKDLMHAARAFNEK